MKGRQCTDFHIEFPGQCLELHEIYLTLHTKFEMRFHMDDIGIFNILHGLKTWIHFIIKVLKSQCTLHECGLKE
jgi:hypothetical protein